MCVEEEGATGAGAPSPTFLHGTHAHYSLFSTFFLLPSFSMLSFKLPPANAILSAIDSIGFTVW